MSDIDQVLLDQLRAGDEEAFAAIFCTHHRQVFAVAYRLTASAQEAEDIAQETFLRLYRRPPLPGREHNLRGWLLKVATNLGYNVLRSQTRRLARETDAMAQEPGGQGARSSEAEDLAERVQAVLAGLPERQVQLLLLRQVGLTYAEVAIALGVAPGSVGTLLARAEQAFRRRYRKLEADETHAQPIPLPR